MEQIDYSLLDIPPILEVMFHPRPDWRPPPPGASDHRLPAPDGTNLAGRLYYHGRTSPSILFFHGNGEVASDYDTAAHLYNEIGINLFVADFRGYGQSEGTPTISNMVSDSHAVLDGFTNLLEEKGVAGPLFVMGRSLGSYPAVELAAQHPSRIRGLIAESGTASVGRALSWFGLEGDPTIQELAAKHEEKVNSISIPLLILHGAVDTLVPISLAEELYESVSSVDKRFVKIPGAGHNDIMIVGLQQYFTAIRDFITDNG